MPAPARLGHLLDPTTRSFEICAPGLGCRIALGQRSWSLYL